MSWLENKGQRLLMPPQGEGKTGVVEQMGEIAPDIQKLLAAREQLANLTRTYQWQIRTIAAYDPVEGYKPQELSGLMNAADIVGTLRGYLETGAGGNKLTDQEMLLELAGIFHLPSESGKEKPVPNMGMTEGGLLDFLDDQKRIANPIESLYQTGDESSQARAAFDTARTIGHLDPKRLARQFLRDWVIEPENQAPTSVGQAVESIIGLEAEIASLSESPELPDSQGLQQKLQLVLDAITMQCHQIPEAASFVRALEGVFEQFLQLRRLDRKPNIRSILENILRDPVGIIRHTQERSTVAIVRLILAKVDINQAEDGLRVVSSHSNTSTGITRAHEKLSRQLVVYNNHLATLQEVIQSLSAQPALNPQHIATVEHNLHTTQTQLEGDLRWIASYRALSPTHEETFQAAVHGRVFADTPPGLVNAVYRRALAILEGKSATESEGLFCELPFEQFVNLAFDPGEVKRKGKEYLQIPTYVDDVPAQHASTIYWGGRFGDTWLYKGKTDNYTTTHKPEEATASLNRYERDILNLLEGLSRVCDWRHFYRGIYPFDNKIVLEGFGHQNSVSIPLLPGFHRWDATIKSCWETLDKLEKEDKRRGVNDNMLYKWANARSADRFRTRVDAIGSLRQMLILKNRKILLGGEPQHTGSVYTTYTDLALVQDGFLVYLHRLHIDRDPKTSRQLHYYIYPDMRIRDNVTGDRFLFNPEFFHKLPAQFDPREWYPGEALRISIKFIPMSPEAENIAQTDMGSSKPDLYLNILHRLYNRLTSTNLLGMSRQSLLTNQ